MALFIVPPPCGCGWRIRATGARGRGPGLKRPSRRPSGPGKMTSGIAPAKALGEGRRAGVTLRPGASYIGRERRHAIERATMRQRIYLDHASTTPILPEAAAAIAETCNFWANPASPHREGRKVHAAMEDARRRVAAAFGRDGTLIFTSGATEAIALVFARARAKSFIISSVEHPAVMRSAPGARQIAVRSDGTLDLDDLDRALAESEAPLVAVQAVNNETGVIHPLDEIGARVKAAGGLLLADCAQSAGKLPLPDTDFLVIAAHKLGGPPGIGALLVKEPATLEAIGGQEGGYRPGTPAVPSIMGFAAAVEADHGWYEEAKRLRQKLDDGIRAAGGEVVAADAPRVATIAC